jgi:hypothetical protein
MTEKFIEWSKNAARHTCCLLPESQVSQFTGFRSYFKFDETVKNIISENNSMSNLSKYCVYATELFIDIDSGQEAIDYSRQVLQLNNISYNQYVSGSKGIHYHIPLITEEFGVNLPQRHREFVERLNIGADISIYKHCGLFRLAKTRHQKTGKIKELVETFIGNPISTEDIIIEPKIKVHNDYNDTDISKSLFLASTLSIFEPTLGNRHTNLWGLTRDLKNANFSKDFAFELLCQLNDNWTNQKTLEEIKIIIRGEYKDE